MKKTHLIIFITGLLSSLPFFNWFFSRWANSLAAALRRTLPNSLRYEIMIVSADGRGEAKALDRILQLKRMHILGKLVIAGHSNGFRDGLLMANSIPDITVHYFAGIDMTLAPFKAHVSTNIEKFDEFHAVYKRAVFAKDYDMANASYKRIKKSHTAAASDPEVQEKILSQIVNVLTRD